MAFWLVTRGQVQRQKEGRASQSQAPLLPPSPVAAGRRTAEAVQGLLEGPGRTPKPRCLGTFVRRRADLELGRRSPQDVQVGPGDWEQGQGEAEVESSAQ